MLLAVAVGAAFLRSLRGFDDLVVPEHGHLGLAEALEEATAGALPLVQPPRDPEALARRSATGDAERAR